MAGLMEVEKLERFYLSSCTDLPSEARSMHQAFPVIPRSAESEGEPVSKSLSNHQFRRKSKSKSRTRNSRSRTQQSTTELISNGGGRSSRKMPSSATEVKASNSKVKQAFLKVYGSLMSFGTNEPTVHMLNTSMSMSGRMPKLDIPPNSLEGGTSAEKLPRKKLSKEEFIEKINTLVSGLETLKNDISQSQTEVLPPLLINVESPPPGPPLPILEALSQSLQNPTTKPQVQVQTSTPKETIPTTLPSDKDKDGSKSDGKAKEKIGQSEEKDTVKLGQSKVPPMAKSSSADSATATSTSTPAPPPRPSRPPPVKKVVIIGLFVLVLFGIAKLTTSTGHAGSTKPKYFR